MLSKEEMDLNRKEIMDSLLSTGRKGMENVVRYLDENGFFEKPSSLHNHHNWEGGLAQHALGVMRYACEKYPKLPKDSLVIASLLHDVCKIDRSGAPGHGSKSLHLLHSLGLEMTPEEERAIRYHMKSMKPKDTDSPGLQEARKDSLWWAIRKADSQSAKANS